MYLKKVKVRNFKSFAGATEIPFQPGFTGVAGPNGMGKSNISDAVLFVLGPTSSKALRADRLTHLFFNGGASKKPATECEVSLVFDNRDRLLPVETDEVDLTRYVKLAPSDPNGYYSYFYVNGRRSTQSEIDSILSHARLSGDGYNLVQQGDVNKIVSMGPVPRRQLVERLAGIAQYDEELARADGKKAELEQNLSQIHTLLGEVRSHLQGLESQRLQAIQYKQLQDEKLHAEARIARTQHALGRKEVESCEAQLAALGAEVQSLAQTLNGLTAERDRTVQAIDQIDREIAERAGPAAKKFKEELDQKKLDFARLQDRATSLAEALEEARQEVARQKEEVARARKEVDDLTKREKELASTLAEIDTTWQKVNRELKEATADSGKPTGKLAETRRKVLEVERTRKEAEASWQSAVKELEAARAALAAAEQEEAKAEDERRSRALEVKDAELRAKADQGEREKGRSLPDLQKEFHALKAKEKTLEAEVASLQKEVGELNRQYFTLDARLKARLEGGKGGNALGAVDFLLSQRNLGRIAGIRGTVEELAHIEPEHQVAIGVAAGGRFQALVVETDQVAEECIRLLRQEKRGRATFLPLNKMLPGRPHGRSLVAAQSEGSLGFALDLVKFDEALRPAFWYVLGETVVMRDLAGARSQMGGVRLVTLQGDLIEATGAITGGFLDPNGRGRAADSAQDLKRLGDELRSKSEAESAGRRELEKVSGELRTLGEELARRSGAAEAEGSARAVVERELAACRERLKEATARIGLATKARGHAETLLQRTTEREADLAKQLAGLKSEAETLQAQFLEQMPNSVAARIRQLNEALAQAAEHRTQATGELEGVRSSLAAAKHQLEEKEAELGRLETALPSRQKELAGVEKDREKARESLETMKTVESRQLEAVKGQDDKKRSLEEGRLRVVEKIARLQENVDSKSRLQKEEEIRLATARQKLSEMEEALRAYPEAGKAEKPVPLDELKRTVQTIQAQLASMGDVNLRALEEYDQEKTRLDEFESQVKRLTDEKAELQTLVGEIETKKRTRLTEVVTQVNAGFHEIYGELSGGGEGEIVLENAEDPLAGGLLIRARPVGKVVQRLEQLSGGEKSLASLAFVFALQRYDPSPLYVFDEVDMSLDGVNAENVGRMLRRNAERAQFVVISLRKVTLKFAHRLFGVTMHGDGCSRVVGLRLDEIVDVDEKDRLGARTEAAEAA